MRAALAALVLVVAAAGCDGTESAAGPGNDTTGAIDRREPPDGGGAGGLRIVDRHFLELGGEPVALFGTGNFWTLADPEVDFRSMIDAYAADGSNLMRMSILGHTVAKRRGLEPSRVLHPFRRVPGSEPAADGGARFDVDLLDPRWFARLDSVARHAAGRGVVLILLLWDEIPLESEGEARWSLNPYHPANNVNGLGLPEADGLPEFYDLSNGPLLESQERLARRVLETVRPHGNVIVGISNEYTGPPAWHRHWDGFVEAFNEGGPGPPLLTNELEYGFSPPYTDLISLSTSNAGGPGAWRPDRPVVSYRTGPTWGDDPDGARRAFWSAFVHGGHTSDDSHDGHRPPDYHDSDAMREARAQLRVLRSLLEELPVNEMVPAAALAADPCTAPCRVAPGRVWVVYLAEGGDVTVDLSEATDTLRASWIDPRNGRRSAPDAVAGGERRTFRSPFGEAVLWIRR